jgi:hypothetical protein
MEKMKILTVTGLGALALMLGACGAESSEADGPSLRGVPVAEVSPDDPTPPVDEAGSSVVPCRGRVNELLPC